MEKAEEREMIFASYCMSWCGARVMLVCRYKISMKFRMLRISSLVINLVDEFFAVMAASAFMVFANMK